MKATVIKIESATNESYLIEAHPYDTVSAGIVWHDENCDVWRVVMHTDAEPVVFETETFGEALDAIAVEVKGAVNVMSAGCVVSEHLYV